MSLFRGLGFRKDATRGTTPIEVRKSLAGLFSATGVMPGGPSPLLTGNADWTYTVHGPAWFVATRGPSDGVALYGNDGDTIIGTTGVGSTVPIAPGAGLSRIDIAWTRHQSAGENGDPATTVALASEPLFGVASGTAASSSPVAPVIPAGAIELGRNTMTSAATSTASAGNTITQSAPVAALRGTETPGAWAAYTPALTSSGTAPTLGTGNTVGNYTQTGKKVDGTTEVLWGVSPTAGTGFYVITMPVAANLHGMADLRVGTITLIKQSTGAQVNADLVMVNATQAKFSYSTGTGTAAIAVSGITQPWVPANGDVYYAQFSYEAA